MQLHDSDIRTREVLDWQGIHLIHFQGSSCSQKTRIFLNLKGIDWQPHHLNLATAQNYEPWFLGINPRGLVPVLIHDGAVHIESNDILIYLDDAFPEPPLIPAAQKSDLVAALQEEDDLHMDIRTLTMRFVFPKFLAQKKEAAITRFDEDEGRINGQADPHKAAELEFWNRYAREGVTDSQAKRAAENFRAVYERFEAELQHRKYLAGDSLTLLDIAWFIYSHRLSAAGYPFQRLHPRLAAWFADLARRPEFSKEVAGSVPVRLVTGGLRLAQSVRGSTLEKVAGF